MPSPHFMAHIALHCTLLSGQDPFCFNIRAGNSTFPLKNHCLHRFLVIWSSVCYCAPHYGEYFVKSLFKRINNPVNLKRTEFKFNHHFNLGQGPITLLKVKYCLCIKCSQTFSYSVPLKRSLARDLQTRWVYVSSCKTNINPAQLARPNIWPTWDSPFLYYFIVYALPSNVHIHLSQGKQQIKSQLNTEDVITSM